MIKFELENWEVSTSKPTSPLYRVTDIFYDEDYSVGVSKTSTSEILGVAKQSFEPEQVAILIASVNINRKKSGKYSKLYPIFESISKLPEDVITDGLKRLLSSTASYEFDSLLNLFEELTPKQLEEVLKSESPVHAIAEYLN